MKTFILISHLFLTSSYGGNSSTVGPGNPASILCKKLSGVYEAYYTDEGQDGLCSFGRGKIPQWTLFRYKRGHPAKAVELFLQHPKIAANTAEQYCQRLKGKVEIVESDSEENLVLCVFSDDSSIEGRTLFRGPKSSSNKKIVRALKAHNS